MRQMRTDFGQPVDPPRAKKKSVPATGSLAARLRAVRTSDVVNPTAPMSDLDASGHLDDLLGRKTRTRRWIWARDPPS